MGSNQGREVAGTVETEHSGVRLKGVSDANESAVLRSAECQMGLYTSSTFCISFESLFKCLKALCNALVEYLANLMTLKQVRSDQKSRMEVRFGL